MKLSINVLGGNLLSEKLSDSISLLLLSKINQSELGVTGKRRGDESFAVLICFSAYCQVEAQVPFIHGKGSGDCPVEPLCHSWPGVTFPNWNKSGAQLGEMGQVQPHRKRIEAWS
jgi:hypothetical protein